MRYSVYNHGTHRYDYYEDSRVEGTHAGAPSGLASGKIGVAPEAGGWRLPMGAKKVGAGEMAKGRIATLRGLPMGAVDFASSPGKLLVLVGVGYLAYRAWGKR